MPCPDGTEFSHTVPANQFSSANSQAEANAFADSYCQQQAHLKQICFTSEPPNGCKDSDYYWLITASGGVPPYTFSLIPGAALPPGLTLYPTGEVSGVPTTTTGFAADISVTDSEGRTNTRIFSFSIAEITTASPLPSAFIGSAYNETLVAAGAPSGAQWSVVSGSLPTGITINPTTGVLSGTPTEIGDYHFTIALTLAPLSCSKDFLIRVTDFVWSNPQFLGACASGSVTIDGPLATLDVATGITDLGGAGRPCGHPCSNDPGLVDDVTYQAEVSGALPAAAQPGTVRLTWTWSISGFNYNTYQLINVPPISCFLLFAVPGFGQTRLRPKVNGVGGVIIHHSVTEPAGTQVVDTHINPGDVFTCQFILSAFGGVANATVEYEWIPDP